MARVRRELWPARSGFVASQRRWQAPLDSLTDASYDWLIDPTEQKLIRRGGSYLLGQTLKDINEVTQQFESGPTYGDLYARQVLEFDSPAINDGLPTHMILYGNDNTAGLVLWMSPNTYTVDLCSMAVTSTILDTSTANGFQDVTIGARVQIPGLTGVARVTELDPNGTGLNNNVRLDMEADANIVSQTATIGGPLYGLNQLIGLHWTEGLHYMTAVQGVSGLAATAAHRAKIAMGSRRVEVIGDYVYLGNGASGNLPLCFNSDWNDQRTGSRIQRTHSMGLTPPLFLNIEEGSRAKLGDSFNWKAGKTYFFSVMYRNKEGAWSRPFIPRYRVADSVRNFGYFKVVTDCDDLSMTIPTGPDGTTARAILRTVAGTEAVAPPLLDQDGNSLLGIAALIENNTETSYKLTNGNDGNLVFDPTIVRFDQVWPKPTRYLWIGDQRLWGCGTQPSPAAILVAPRDATAGDPAGTGALYYFSVAQPTITFNRKSSAGTAGVGFSVTTTGKTLDQIVDEINASQMTSIVVGGTPNTLYWCAQLAPGADPGALATDLADTTSVSLGGYVTPGPVLGANDVPAFGPGRPGILMMSSSYLANQPTGHGDLWFSIGDPGGPQGPSSAVSIKNFRRGRKKWGFAVGGAPLLDGQLVAFSKAITVCRNIRDTKTGLDQDYRLEALNENRGCISDASIVYGDGWAGYMTTDGYIVTDGTREVLISGALYSPATGQGILASPIQNCITALGTRQGEACARYVTAWLDGPRLCLGLALAATSPSVADDPILVYDFSRGAAGSGLAEVLQPNGEPWPWSPPQSYGPKFIGVRAALAGGTVGRLKDSGAGRRVVVASSYLSSSAPSTPHGVIGRIFEPTAIDFLQLDLNGTTHSATTTLSSNNLTAVSGDLSRIPVGAIVIEVGSSRIPVGSLVTAVSGTTVTLDRPADSNGTVTVFFWGRDIEPAAYLATDMCDSLNMKSLQGAWALYNQTGSGMEIQITNELDRTGQVTFLLPAAASADGFSRQKLNVTQALRGLSKAYEAIVIDRGTTTQQSEFWGLATEVDILDSHR